MKAMTPARASWTVKGSYHDHTSTTSIRVIQHGNGRLSGHGRTDLEYDKTHESRQGWDDEADDGRVGQVKVGQRV